MKKSVALLLAVLMVFCSVAAVSAEEKTPTRLVVHQETFEEGIEGFTTQDGAVLDWEEDENGNHYVIVRLNPEKIEMIATYTFSRTTNGVVHGGRWGTEFFTWPIQFNTRFNLENNRNYQFMFDGSYHNGTSFGKVYWGTGVLQMNTNCLWTTPDAEDAKAGKEVFATPLTGAEMAGKSGWYDCYSGATWLSNYKFGATRTLVDGVYQFSGEAPMNYYHVRTNLATAIAKIMADNKFYCGKGTGLTNASGQIQTGNPWGGYYKFTLTRDDFYGDEAIFEGVTDPEEINRIKDSYIYEDDGETLTEYSLGHDCSFLESQQRIDAFKAHMANFKVGYAMDNLRIVADSYEYTDTVTVTGSGSVKALTNPAIGAETTVNSGESKPVTTNDYFGVTYTITPAQGYKISSVKYGGSDVTPMMNQDGTFVVSASSVTADKALEVAFVEDIPEPPRVLRVRAVDTSEAYQYNGKQNPSAVLFIEVVGGTDGSAISQTGAKLNEKGNTGDPVELPAKNADGTDFKQEGIFGIRVFGDAFTGGYYYFVPYVSYEDSEGQSHTEYGDEEEFSLGESGDA